MLRLKAALLTVIGLSGATGFGVHQLTAPTYPDAPVVSSRSADPYGRFPRPGKVALLALENRSYEEIIGNHKVPYMNRLARENALAARSYAVAHPSLPNYIALTSGTSGEIHNDCASCDSEATNLVDQMNRAHVSWRAYFQGIPRPGSLAIRHGNYSAHYNPFAYYSRTRSRDGNQDRTVSFRALDRDLRANRLPRFSWIGPNLGHDGHNNSLASTDRYMSRLVPRVLKALGPRGLLYLTWDEGKPDDKRGLNGKGGGRIVLIAAGPMARHGVVSRQPFNQYALLRTLEAGFGLPTLGAAGASSSHLLLSLVRDWRASPATEGRDRWLSETGWRSASKSIEAACAQSPTGCSAR